MMHVHLYRYVSDGSVFSRPAVLQLYPLRRTIIRIKDVTFRVVNYEQHVEASGNPIVVIRPVRKYSPDTCSGERTTLAMLGFTRIE